MLNKFLEKVLGFLLQLLKQIDNFSRIKGLISQMIWFLTWSKSNSFTVKLVFLLFLASFFLISIRKLGKTVELLVISICFSL